MWYRRLAIALSFVPVLLSGCGSEPTLPEESERTDFDNPPIPPPGRFFTVSPLPTDRIASISTFGHNNKIFPTNKNYVATCDYGLTSRPCHLERLPVRSPGDGVVYGLDRLDDGSIMIEGPPGLFVGFQHITPAPNLSVDDSVRAGDVVGTMFYEHSLDFGMTDFRVTQDFINRQRTAPLYLHSETPLARYAEPVRSELLALVRTEEDPLGRIEFDVEGTTSGLWFLEGAPTTDQAFTVDWLHAQLFLGPLAENYDLGILVTGTEWGGFRIAAVDPDAPRWEAITPASGPTQIRLWDLNHVEYDVRPPLRGSILVEMLDEETVRVEWFDTHEAVADFTAGASIYER